MRRPLIFVVVPAVVLLTPITALAAMDAMLSSTHARPGDSVLLLTDDHKGTSIYDGLSSENQQPIYLAPTTGNWADACGGLGSSMVGRLQWRGNAAGLAFIVPSLPFADYWLFMKTQGQCWRVAGQAGAGPLILTVGTSPADNQHVAMRWTVDSLPPPRQSVSHPSPVPQTSSPASLWLAIAGGSVLVLLVLALGLNRLRQRSSRT